MKLLQQYEAACQARHLARRTVQTYTRWVEEFVRYHRSVAGKWRHPRELQEPEVTAFLTHLAVNRRIAESTQNQALAALLFLYRHVLQLPLGNLDAVRAQRPKRLPTVLSQYEVQRLIAALPAHSATRGPCDCRAAHFSKPRNQLPHISVVLADRMQPVDDRATQLSKLRISRQELACGFPRTAS